MRIIAGNLKGRVFNDPPNFSYNPMSEKMRGALFNTLGDIEDLTVFDPFGGTGALGLEAVSRGAASALVVELDKKAYQNIVGNIKMLEATDRVKAIRANASGWSDKNPGARFNLVLMDPPYDHIKPALIEKLAAHTNPGGIVVISKPPRVDVALPRASYKMLTLKSYGDAQLIFYRKS